MMSGRGLGHTGGTVDKLESIPGFATRLDGAAFRAQVEELGCAFIGQSDAIAPADRRLYALRDVTATVESIDLITASILSKKLAAGLEGLVLDVKVGSGAFMKSAEEAEALAEQALVLSTCNRTELYSACGNDGLGDLRGWLTADVRLGPNGTDFLYTLEDQQAGDLDRASPIGAKDRHFAATFVKGRQKHGQHAEQSGQDDQAGDHAQDLFSQASDAPELLQGDARQHGAEGLLPVLVDHHPGGGLIEAVDHERPPL